LFLELVEVEGHVCGILFKVTKTTGKRVCPCRPSNVVSPGKSDATDWHVGYTWGRGACQPRAARD
jgi:hypothetical protein